MDPDFPRSVPDIVRSLAQHPDQLQHVIPFFFKTREYRKLHEILKAVIKADQVIDDTCLRLYGSSVSDLTIATVCETWSWYLSFKLTPALIHLFRVFLKHICISEDSLVPSSRADFADRLKETENLIDSQLQKDDRVEWLRVCHIIGHIKLLYMFHGPETMRQLTKKVKWHDMSLLFGMVFDWESFFTESLSSDGPEKEIAIQLLGLKLRFCDVMYAFSESKQLRDSRQQLVHRLLMQPDIGSYLLRDSAVGSLLQSANQPEDVQLLAQAVVKQFHRKRNNHAKANEAALSSPAFQTAVVGSTIAELLQVASKGNDLHLILSMLCDVNTGWIEFQYSVPRENNKCWLAIREASQILMQSKQSPDDLFTVSSSRIGLILNGLRNFVFFPTLLPLNQSRCMILYVMLLLRWSRDKMRESLIDAFITMLGGLRSVWIFDFVPPSFVLLNLPNEAPQMDTLVKAIITRILKYENLLTDFNDNIANQKGLGEKSRLQGVLLQAYMESKVNGHVCKAGIVNEVVEAAISRVLKGLRRAEEEDSERFVKSAEHLHSLSILLRLDPENSRRKIVALVKKVLRNIFSSDEILNNDEAEFLEAVCEKRQKLDAILSEEFMSELCNKVLGPKSGARHEASSSSFSSTDVREIISREAKRFKSEKAVKCAFHANLIRSMLESCNETESTSLCEYLRSRFAETRDPDNSVVLIRYLEVWANHRTAAAGKSEHRDADAAAALMFDLTNRLRNGVGEEVNVELVVSTLNLTQGLMRTQSGKWSSVNAALNVTALALHEIRKLGPAAGCVTEFAGIFLAVQAVLYQAIVCQKIAVITVMPYFNILSSRLFRMCLSLCDEELLNTCSPAGRTAAERCAQSVSTLITSLCNLCDFHPFAAQLVVTYVDGVHSHIIHHRIKPVLLSCVYRLLRVIGNKHSHTLERQHVRLNQPGKDLLKQLTANYEQFYRYRGYV